MEPFFLSKQTQDKVKLAKKYIQDKYQNILFQQKLQKQNWQKILKSISQNQQIPQPKKKSLQKKFISHQLQQKRLTRQKDSLKNYDLYQLIGKGSFGQVRIAKNKQSNEIVAIKRIQKKKLVDKKQLTSAYAEKELMIKNNDSQFLIKLYSTFQDKKYLYLVMEYAAGGDLLHHLIEKNTLTEEETKFYIAELVVALEEMQSRNMIHRDIKPDNILIDKYGHIKISDFGLSKHMITIECFPAHSRFQERKSDQKNYKEHKFLQKQNLPLEKILKIKERTAKVFSKVGTPDYISPQVLSAKYYDYSVDIWSTGVIMFECLFGYLPFANQNPKQVCKNVVNWSSTLKFPSDIPVSINAKTLVLGMINQRNKRLGIEQIKRHNFFQGIEWRKIKEYEPPMIPVLESQLDTSYFEQYDQSQKWVDQSSNFIEQNNKSPVFSDNKRTKFLTKVRSTSADYLFAGFDYKNIKTQPFKIIQPESSIPNPIKYLIRNSLHNFRKSSPMKENRTLKRLMTEKKSHQKTKQSKTENQSLRKYLINKSIHLFGNSIYNPNQTINTFNNCSLKQNCSINDFKDKSILCKDSKLRSIRKKFNCIKTVNKLTY